MSGADLGIATALIAVALAAVVVWLLLRVKRSEARVRAMTTDARLIADANPRHRLKVAGPGALAELAAAINGLGERLSSEADGVEDRTRAARADAEGETRQLAALIAQMSQGVLVCSSEGRIRLYNAHARRLVEPGSGADGGGLVGLGRSIFGFLDQNLVRHGLEELRLRAAQGQPDPAASLMATIGAGHLVRLRLSRAGEGDDGFVILLEDVTQSVEAAGRVDALLQSLTEGTRAALASLRAAVESLDAFPDMEPERRARFMAIIGEETAKLGEALEGAGREYAGAPMQGWPLEPIAAGDLLGAAARRIEAKLGIAVGLEALEPGLWLRADGYSLLQALTYLASRLRYELGVAEVRLRAAREGAFARLDLRWPGSPLALDAWHDWEAQPLRMGGEASPLTLGEILRRHGAEAWQQYDAQSACGLIEILIPPGAHDPEALSHSGNDDIVQFEGAPRAHPGNSAPLARMTATAIEVETEGGPEGPITGLGAARIVEGSLIAQETFGQATADAPALEAALPVFHRFCRDSTILAWDAGAARTLLRAHEVRTGTRFAQPFVDLRTLFATIRPGDAVKSATDAATVLGVAAPGGARQEHALMLGGIFLRMVPLLAERGITRIDQLLR